MLKEVILLEYFTAQSTTNFKGKKSIFKEAIKLSNSLALNFSRNRKIKKIHLLRNASLQRLKNKKIVIHYVTKNKTIDKILDKFDHKTNLLLISPESEFENSRLYQKLSKKFTLLNSSFKNIKIFSSKLKTFKALKQINVKTIEIEKKLRENIQYISKPEFGTGSSNIVIFKKKNNICNQKKAIIQKFYKGKKGSFGMLCCDKKFEIICCNEQILKFHNDKISQIGLIMGGLESHRNEIYAIGKKICSSFPELFGFIGIDIVRVNNDWRVIEINPRFTSAYIGLEQAYGIGAINRITEFYINKKIEKTNYSLKKKVKIYF